MVSAIIGFLTSLPKLIALATDIWNYLNKVSGNDPAGYIARVGQAMSLLTSAQTEEEHANAAKAIADAIAHQPTSQ